MAAILSEAAPHHGATNAGTQSAWALILFNRAHHKESEGIVHMRKYLLVVTAGVTMSVMSACGGRGADPTDFTGMALTTAQLQASPTNAFADDARAAALGRELFFDTGFSADGTVGCVSCHDPAHGFSDPRARWSSRTARRSTCDAGHGGCPPSVSALGWQSRFGVAPAAEGAREPERDGFYPRRSGASGEHCLSRELRSHLRCAAGSDGGASSSQARGRAMVADARRTTR